MKPHVLIKGFSHQSLHAQSICWLYLPAARACERGLRWTPRGLTFSGSQRCAAQRDATALACQTCTYSCGQTAHLSHLASRLNGCLPRLPRSQDCRTHCGDNSAVMNQKTRAVQVWRLRVQHRQANKNACARPHFKTLCLTR